jgi:hypothetical protein
MVRLRDLGIAPGETIVLQTTGGRGGGRGGTPKGPIKKGNGPDPTEDLPEPTPDPPKPRKPRQRIQTRVDVFQRQKSPLRLSLGAQHCQGAAISYYRRLPDNKSAYSGRKLVVYELEYGPADITNISIGGKTLAGLGADWNLYRGDGVDAFENDDIMTAHQPGWTAAYTACFTKEPRARKIARLVVLFGRPTTTIPDVDVRAIEYDTSGCYCPDPEQDPTLATVYPRTGNPRLAIALIETDERFGGGFPNDVIYGEPNFQQTVDDCDADLGGGRKRYELAIALDEAMTFDQCMEQLRGHAALSAAYVAGHVRWWVQMDRDNSGVVFANGIAPGNIVNAQPLKYKAPYEMPTRVTVKFRDRAAGWKEDFRTSDHPLLESGGLELNEWVKEYWGIPTGDQAQRIADMERETASIPEYGVLRVMAEGVRVLPGSRITLTNVVQWNIAESDWYVLRATPVNGMFTWDLLVRPYVNVWDDSDQTTTPYLAAANPSPNDPPDAPTAPSGATSLTLGDGLTELPDGRYALTYILPSWPFQIRSRVTIEYAGSGELDITPAGDGPVIIDRAVLPTVRVYSVVVESGVISTGVLTGTVAAVVPADIGGAYASATISVATLYFDAAQILSSTLYGAAFWSNGSGLLSFNAARVNDGSTGVAAFTTPAGTSHLNYSGGANPKRFRRFDIYHGSASGLVGATAFYWSVDNSTWNEVDSTGYQRTSLGGGVYLESHTVEDPGASRLYWRVSFSASNVIYDVHPREFLGEDPSVVAYRVYDIRSGSPVLAFPTIPRGARPTSATPLDCSAIVSRTQAVWNNGGSASLWLEIRAVGVDGSESAGLREVTASTWAATGMSSVYSFGTLAVGTATVPSGRALYVNQGDANTLARIEGTSLAGWEFMAGSAYFRQFADTSGDFVVARNAGVGRNDAIVDANGVLALPQSLMVLGTQFDKVNSNALSAIADLTRTLVAGRAYEFEATLFTTSSSGGGVKVAVGGTCTATAVRYEVLVFNGGACVAQGRASALGTAVAGITGVTDALILVYGTIVVNAAGTLAIQFAQNAVFGSASSVLTRSRLRIIGD